MKLKTDVLLKALNVLAWIVFFGLCIKVGAILFSYFVSIGNPQAARDLYMGLDLHTYRQQNFANYTILVGYLAVLYSMQAYVAFLVTGLLSRINISKPFSEDVAKLMQKISVNILSIWVVAMIHNLHMGILEKSYGFAARYIPGEFIFLAGIVYVIAQMFKRGVEIQSENELTV